MDDRARVSQTPTDGSNRNRVGKGGWIWLLASVLVVALGVGVFVLLRFVGAQDPSAETPAPPLVRAVEATAAATLDLTQTGFVVPRARVDVVAKVAGRIREISADFQVGRALAAGQMILSLEEERYQADVARASAAVQQAEAALAEAKVDRDRQEELQERDIAAEATLQQAVVAVAAAEADLAAARATLTEAQLALDDTVITAPFDAVVTEESAAVGQYVGAGTSVGTIVAADAAEVRFGLSPRDEALLGRPSRALGGPIILYANGVRLPFEAVVNDIDPQIEADTRTVSLIVRIPDPFTGERPLRIDQLVEMRLPVQLGERGAVDIPLEALKPDGVVWRVADGALQRVAVTVLKRLEDRVVLAGRAIAPGDRVMVSDLLAPFDGQRVRVETAEEGG